MVSGGVVEKLRIKLFLEISRTKNPNIIIMKVAVVGCGVRFATVVVFGMGKKLIIIKLQTRWGREGNWKNNAISFQCSWS